MSTKQLFFLFMNNKILINKYYLSKPLSKYLILICLLLPHTAYATVIVKMIRQSLFKNIIKYIPLFIRSCNSFKYVSIYVDSENIFIYYIDRRKFSSTDCLMYKHNTGLFLIPYQISKPIVKKKLDEYSKNDHLKEYRNKSNFTYITCRCSFSFASALCVSPWSRGIHQCDSPVAATLYSTWYDQRYLNLLNCHELSCQLVPVLAISNEIPSLPRPQIQFLQMIKHKMFSARL